MRWRAHELDGRISAKNALKIRAALRSSTKWERVFEAYKRTQPAVSNNPAQDRARARAWAMLSVPFDNDALIAALRRTWADGFALGIVSADDAIRQAKELKKADDPDYIDWANWKPGDAAAALLIKPTKAFQRLLEAQGATIRGIDRTGYDRLGTALADAIALGLSGRRAAKLIQDSVSDPARALTIAITETNRAISRATIERYQQFGLEQMEWVTSDPCDKCVLNEGKVVNVGATFPSGDTQPPVHPNCRCALLPVVPDFEAPVDGIEDIMPPQITYTTDAPAGIITQDDLDKWQEGYHAQFLSNEGDSSLAGAYKIRGYNGLPQVVSREEFDALVKETGGTTVFRGVKSAGKPAAEYIHQYKYGTHYAGFGFYGNGTYATTRIQTAIQYAEGVTENIVRVLLPDTSNFVTEAIVMEKRDAVIAQLVTKFEAAKTAGDKVLRDKLYEQIQLLEHVDSGTWATLLGYDGIKVVVSDLPVDIEDYYVILNRGKVIVER